MSDPIDHEMMLRDAQRSAGKPLQDFERFLLFMGLATPPVLIATFSDMDRLIDFFAGAGASQPTKHLRSHRAAFVRQDYRRPHSISPFDSD